MLSGRGRVKAFRDKISQDCPDCGNRVLAIRINGFYAGSRDRIFLWECPICEAVWKNDLESARGLHHRLFEVNQAVFFDTNPIPMKYMMKRLGIIPENEHRLPMVAASAELAARLDQVLTNAGLLD